jgi:hypothetical protein
LAITCGGLLASVFSPSDEFGGMFVEKLNVKSLLDVAKCMAPFRVTGLGDFLANWVIVFFGQFLNSAQVFVCYMLYFHVKSCALI